MGNTVTAQFADRRSADLAIEHLVQEYGVDRTDVFVSPASQENSAGSQAAGADAESGLPDVDVDAAPALGGDIEVSVDLNTDNLDDVRAALIEAGGDIIEK